MNNKDNSTLAKAIYDAAERIANCYCADDGAFFAEKERLITGITQLVTRPRPSVDAVERAREIVVSVLGLHSANSMTAKELIVAIATALSAQEAEIIELKLEIARLRVRPIVDAEKQSENLDDIINLRFTSGR